MHRCSILTLVYLSCASHHLIAKSCFAMQPFLSVYPVYDSPCMTWTVYWTLILRRLPTLILPALFTDYSECLPPAPIQTLSSDSDSALPTLRLKLVIKLCLSYLHTLLIKLHMDPNALDSSLQKTSPHSDPAVFYHVTTEVSAQATVLATQQQQLNHLTSLTEELVRSLRALHLPAPSMNASLQHSPSPASTAASATASPRLAFPEKFDGSPTRCKGFLLQCSMFIGQQPTLYPTDDSRIAFVCSLLTGRALEWATAIWEDDHAAFPSFASFTQSFKEVFEHPAGGEEVGEQLLSLRQGGDSAADYALSFRTLAAQTGWRDAELLKLLFRKGLNHDLQSELACRDEGRTLGQFITLAIRLDNSLRSRRLPRSSLSSATMATAPPATEPMQIGMTRMSEEERERRIRQRLCLYCGLPGHLRASCPTRPSRTPAAVSATSNSATSLEIAVTLEINGRVLETVALIDSGAAGNFIDGSFAKSNNIPLVACTSHLAVAALDGRPLGSGSIQFTTADLQLSTGLLHTEIIRLFVFQSPRNPIILGLPWLEQHNPSISWAKKQITQWSDFCLQNCLRSMPVRRRGETSSNDSLPREYHDLAEAFSKVKALHLPPHRASDCAIDLLPGSQPPKGRVFPLSQPEAEAMKSYIEEELAKGFIRPSTSPASAGFFFVKKKDGGLRPCIDYRSLNSITCKFRYPLPLVPSALEQLRRARYFTKLDLRCAYNLIRIREGDEWKTAFSTTTGHYEYLVMPFGLSNSPSVFQAFINDVFRDMLNQWVIVYIDDILIYSETYEEHVIHVRTVLKRLLQHQLYAKAEKCEFHQETISFLGYIISSGGVAMDEQKVQAVVNWPQPTTLKELQRFLGFANFYRRFIRNFSTVAGPMTSMVKKGTHRLSWSSAAIASFRSLKERFTTAPILHHPDPDLEFTLEVDASSTGIGAVLSQRQGDPPKLYPCAFFSRKLNPTEQNYDVGNRELLAMKAAFEEWRHWLEGASHSFTVLTDHRNLEYLKSAKRLNHRQARWSLFFTRFDFRITYRPGSQNTKADALSRLHESDSQTPDQEPILPPTIILAPVLWDILTEITEAQVTDPPPTETPDHLTYVPQVLRQKVIQLVHSSPSSGHPGIAATLQLLNNKFWWSTLRTDTITFIQNCTVCNTSKSLHQLPAGLLGHWFCDGFTTLSGPHYHPHRNRSLLQGLQVDTSSQTSHCPGNGRSPVQLCIQVLWSARGYSVRPGSAVHIPRLVSLLSTIGNKCQPHFRVPPSGQWSSGTAEPGAHPLPPIILSQEPARLESLPALGWVCSELNPQTIYRHHSLPMRPRLPTPIVSMVWRTLRITRSQFMVTAQWGDMGRGWWPKGPSHHRWRPGGISGQRNPGLSSPGQIPTVSHRLGGVRSGGTVLGQCWGYPRPFTDHRLP